MRFNQNKEGRKCISNTRNTSKVAFRMESLRKRDWRQISVAGVRGNEPGPVDLLRFEKSL